MTEDMQVITAIAIMLALLIATPFLPWLWEHWQMSRQRKQERLRRIAEDLQGIMEIPNQYSWQGTWEDPEFFQFPSEIPLPNWSGVIHDPRSDVS